MAIRNPSRLVSRAEIWTAGLAVAGGVALPQLLLPALLVLLLFWPLRRWATGRWTERTPADLGILALLLLGILNGLLSPLPQTTTPQVYRLAVGIGFYYALANWLKEKRQLKWVIAAILAAGMGLAAFSFISVDWTQTKLPFLPAGLYERFQVLVADTMHPNVLAGNLVVLLSGLAAGLLWGWRRVSARLYLGYGLLLGAMAAILMLTQSRGALLAFGAAVLVLAALRWRWGWLVFLPATAVLVWAVNAGGTQDILNTLLAGAALDGFEGREEIWARAVFIIQDFPLTGIGMGLFWEAVEPLYPFLTESQGPVAHAHNIYFQVAVDLGLPGLVAWLSVFLLSFASAWHLLRRGKQQGQPWMAGLGAGLLAAQAALAFHGFLDAVTWGMIRSAPLVWGLWGLAAAAGQLQTKNENRQ